MDFSMNNNILRSIADIRKNYSLAELNEDDMHKDPFSQFNQWFEEAQQAKIEDVNAMALATASANGLPSVRMVLLKGFDDHGFVFFTNYLSRKGGELAENPHAALNFFWKEIERQIRIEGTISKVSRADSEVYFHSRPRPSQIGALASAQSRKVKSKDAMLNQYRIIEKEFEGKEIPLPDNWGGFLLLPRCFEFWQGRPSRMHDRIIYEINGTGKWNIMRLYP
jgi:pyridoxamine-phosphate oxidase